MGITKEMLNQVLVKIFNTILFNEETYVKEHLGDKITLRNMHVLDAVYVANEEGNSSMSNISNKLGITAGTLTIALKRLEKDGYITKTQSTKDKRVYNIKLTSEGVKILKVHSSYHKKMIDTITSNLSIKEEANLIDLLSKIKYYFTK